MVRGTGGKRVKITEDQNNPRQKKRCHSIFKLLVENSDEHGGKVAALRHQWMTRMVHGSVSCAEERDLLSGFTSGRLDYVVKAVGMGGGTT